MSTMVRIPLAGANCEAAPKGGPAHGEWPLRGRRRGNPDISEAAVLRDLLRR